MRSQWDSLLQNLGTWEGSFTKLSPQGDLMVETPTVVVLEGLNNDQIIRQTIRRLVPKAEAPSQHEAQEQVLEYSSLNRSILFFEDGAFSQGSLQLGPLAEFGAELGLIAGDRRLRVVIMFNRQSHLEQITLIREKRAGTEVPERLPLRVADLIGDWHGEAITIYPDWRSPDLYATQLQIRQTQPDQLTQTLTFGSGDSTRSISSTATIAESILRFEQGPQPVQVLLLSDGASVNCPTHLKLGQPFVLEAGWLIQPNLRQRIVRRYDAAGGWVSLTLVTEHKVSVS